MTTTINFCYSRMYMRTRHNYDDKFLYSRSYSGSRADHDDIFWYNRNYHSVTGIDYDDKCLYSRMLCINVPGLHYDDKYLYRRRYQVYPACIRRAFVVVRFSFDLNDNFHRVVLRTSLSVKTLLVVLFSKSMNNKL